MVEGRRKWVERMKKEGKKFLCGRKAGLDWVTPKMKERTRQSQEAAAKEDRAVSAVELEDLTNWSLEHLRKVLAMPLPPNPTAKEFLHIMKLKNAVARAILSIQCRTDTTCLKAKVVDIMPRIIAILKGQADILNIQPVPRLTERKRVVVTR
jgi:hypothetical protein